MKHEEIITSYNLSEKDLKELKDRGISLEELDRQVKLIKKGTDFIELARPCTVDDGLLKIDESDFDELIKIHGQAADEERFMKFVPASGAASRMFKKLESVLNSFEKITLEELKKKKNDNDDIGFTFEFISNLNKFAFYEELKDVLKKNNYNIDELLSEGDINIILKFFLKEKGMNYTNKSKALLKFHKYPNENRTALEEHIKESIEYAGSKNLLNLHFTVPPEQIDDFENLASKMKEKYSDYHLNIEFSFQKKSTDTVALNNNGNLFRIDDKILFRPGGHGALIQNLNDLNGDLVYIKNVDNVQREENLETTVLYKKLIAGILIKSQNKIFELLKVLEAGKPDAELIKRTETFVKNELLIDLFEEYETYSLSERKEYLFNLLNRPVRVCGMVLNEGHPGGGPFWVKDKNGSLSKQIIEDAQVDKENKTQREIFASSTHFNPVDIVAGLKNYQGKYFDLNKYVNRDAVFIADKSKDGRSLKALELPGLWNAGMHDWISIFVEVPKSTFTPVKEVNDLLKEEHT